MKNSITRVDALNYAINAIDQCTETDAEVVAILEKIRDQIAKPRATSEEAKAKRKEATAAARAKLMEAVMPVLRAGLPEGGCTAKELYTLCADKLPEDFTANKVQYVLLNEMRDEVEKIETKNKPNIYKPKKEED